MVAVAMVAIVVEVAAATEAVEEGDAEHLEDVAPTPANPAVGVGEEDTSLDLASEGVEEVNVAAPAAWLLPDSRWLPRN